MHKPTCHTVLYPESNISELEKSPRNNYSNYLILQLKKLDLKSMLVTAQ